MDSRIPQLRFLDFTLTPDEGRGRLVVVGVAGAWDGVDPARNVTDILTGRASDEDIQTALKGIRWVLGKPFSFPKQRKALSSQTVASVERTLVEQRATSLGFPSIPRQRGTRVFTANRRRGLRRERQRVDGLMFGRAQPECGRVENLDQTVKPNQGQEGTETCQRNCDQGRTRRHHPSCNDH